MPDARADFAISAVATAPNTATAGTSLVLTAGEGARCPAVPFKAVICPAATQPSWAAGSAAGGNVEIVDVTARSTDTLTIVRAQDSTTARTVIVGDQVIMGLLKSNVNPTRKVVGNTAYTIGSGPSADGTDKRIYDTFSFTTTLTANRIITLCAANAVVAGTRIRIEDGGGVVTPALTVAAIEIQIKPAGSDTVEGVAAATNFEVIRDTRGSVLLESDGTSDWKIIAVTPHTRYEVFTATVSAGWRKPLTGLSVRIRAIGGGGAGGSGSRSGASPAANHGGGGGAGGGVTELTIPISAFGVTSDVNIGAAGTAGGTRGTTGNGAAGGAGGFSYVTVSSGAAGPAAAGGGGGAGGVSGGGAGGTVGSGGLGASHQNQIIANTGTLGAASLAQGGVGGDGTAPAVAGVGLIGTFGGPGGGGGGGGGTGAAAEAAAIGGNGSWGFGNNGSGVASGAAGANGGGSPGTSAAITSLITGAALGGAGGAGGGARAGNGTAAGVDGAAGALYGGGGGGGSGSCNTTNGNGGAGAAGVLEIVTYR